MYLVKTAVMKTRTLQDERFSGGNAFSKAPGKADRSTLSAGLGNISGLPAAFHALQAESLQGAVRVVTSDLELRGFMPTFLHPIVPA